MPRMTNQKKILYEEIKKFSSFFDAYRLHSRIIKKDQRIGLATIYRFLNTLESDGNIHSFMCDNKKIYSNDKTSHAHFKCEKCGKLKHMKIKNADFLSESIDDDICHFQIELTGICSECKK